MRGPLVLDSEALSALSDRRNPREAAVRAALEAAERVGRPAIIPTVILAELYRGVKHNKAIDACLSREKGIDSRDTDRALARMVGGVLAAANADSRHLADAHVVASAAEKGGGIVLTGDRADLTRLAAPYPNILVQPLP